MKKVFMLFPAMMISSVLLTHGAGTKAEAAEQPLLQVPVISDTHVNKDNPKAAENLVRTLDDLKNVAPNYDAIAVDGDMTEGGFLQEYQAFNQILNDHKVPGAQPFIVMGNHEWFEPTYDKTSSITDAEIEQRFMSFQNNPVQNVYFDQWIKGYHFIALSGEESYNTLIPLSKTIPNILDRAYISDAQYKWLADKLAESSNDPAKPVFVFLHQPIENTVYGSMRWNAGFDDLTRLMPLLKKYPQVILFSGHSHYILNHPKSVYEDGFTMVNTASTSYTWFEDGAVPNLSQGWLMNVYSDRVELKAREFSNGTWIKTVTIPIPFKETAKDTTKPYFTANSNLTVDNVSTNSVTFSWNQGKDDSVVDRYYIKDTAGHWLSSEFSHFWEPAYRESNTISNLTPDTTYNLNLFAVDAYDNIGDKPIPFSFTTKTNFRGWYQNNNIWYFGTNDGTRLKGWYFSNKNWYYLDQNSGAMKTGWAFVNGKWYFFNQSGQMVTGWVKDAGKFYFLETSGAMKTGWVSWGKSWYYFDQKAGSMLTNCWIYDGGKWYYFKADGTMVTGSYMIGGKTNYFSNSGAWIK